MIMKTVALTILAVLVGTFAMAQDKVYKGNPHIIIPTDKPHVSVPFDQQHITLPIPDSQVTNLFSRGYQTFNGEISMIKVSMRKAPENIYCVKIRDFVGNYRIDRVEGTGIDYALYLVKSNETVVIRAHQASETYKNTAEQGVPGYRRQSAPQPEP